jgi:hypothetical protein
MPPASLFVIDGVSGSFEERNADGGRRFTKVWSGCPEFLENLFCQSSNLRRGELSCRAENGFGGGNVWKNGVDGSGLAGCDGGDFPAQYASMANTPPRAGSVSDGAARSLASGFRS